DGETSTRRARPRSHAVAGARGLDRQTDDARRRAPARRRAARARRPRHRPGHADGSRAEPRRRLFRSDRASRGGGGGGGVSVGELATTAPPARRQLTPTLVSDTLAIAWRGLLTYRRVPQLLVFSTIQPVVFVLLFTYVFGGAIHVPGVD